LFKSDEVVVASILILSEDRTVYHFEILKLACDPSRYLRAWLILIKFICADSPLYTSLDGLITNRIVKKESYSTLVYFKGKVYLRSTFNGLITNNEGRVLLLS
jgi:hypothetical protein